LLASCSVHGDILCNSKLSGRAPEVLLSFSNISIIDDMSLHPCVKYNR
jgi:AP-3 complex subunit mu